MRLADRTVLRSVDLTIAPGDRLAVVGENGAGKSTLLAALAGSLALTSGERAVHLPGGMAIAEQHPMFPGDVTVSEALDVLLSDIRGMEQELQRTAELIATPGAAGDDALMEHYSRTLDRFEARDGYRLDLRVDAALEQLGLGGIDRRTAVRKLSGGERARLALAAAVSAEAELLLLDEPTNDLDDEGIAWLEQRLTTHRGALVVVTHDRYFLQRFSTDILAIEEGAVSRYGDGYNGYVRAKAAERQRALELHRTWQEELARSEALVEANAFRLDGIPRRREMTIFGHAAFRARSRDHGAMSRIRIAKSRISSLRAAPAVKPADPLRFTPSFNAAADQTEAGACGEPALIGVSGVTRIPDADGPGLTIEELAVRRGERWLVEGANGAGKTTLLRALAGEIELHDGEIHRLPDLRVAHLRQDLTSATQRSLVDAFATELGAYREDAAEVLLGLGLFASEDLTAPVSALSVGQRRRLELAVALSVPSDVLLLDEPTNHLSPELTEQLEDALDSYEGAVITVTHDRRWRERARGDAQVKLLSVGAGGVVKLIA